MDRVQVLRGFPPYMELMNEIDKNRPTFMGIHMKPFCNFKCTKCFIGEQKKLVGDNSSLTLIEIKTIIDSAKNCGVKVLAISGAGEPLIDKNFFDIIEIANKKGFITVIATNGSMLSKELLVFLRDNNVTITISLDTTDPKRYAEKTGTTEMMFHQVHNNLLLAQEVFCNTKVNKNINGKDIDIYRLAIHMTLQNGEIEEIQKIKNLTTPDTLFSLSPLAKDVGFAKNSNLSKNIPTEIKEELNEKHIVICHDATNQMDICGFFRFGIDISFDGQLLLDSHATETRTLFKNIRDFNYDVYEAFSYLYNSKKDFIENWMDGFCPIRSQKFNDWIDMKQKSQVSLACSMQVQENKTHNFSEVI